LKLRGDVPERFAHELQVGQTVQVHVDAFAETTFTGRLRASARRRTGEPVGRRGSGGRQS